MWILGRIRRQNSRRGPAGGGTGLLGPRQPRCTRIWQKLTIRVSTGRVTGVGPRACVQVCGPDFECQCTRGASVHWQA